MPLKQQKRNRRVVLQTPDITTSSARDRFITYSLQSPRIRVETARKSSPRSRQDAVRLYTRSGRVLKVTITVRTLHGRAHVDDNILYKYTIYTRRRTRLIEHRPSGDQATTLTDRTSIHT